MIICDWCSQEEARCMCGKHHKESARLKAKTVTVDWHDSVMPGVFVSTAIYQGARIVILADEGLSKWKVMVTLRLFGDDEEGVFCDSKTIQGSEDYTREAAVAMAIWAVRYRRRCIKRGAFRGMGK
jgi:hypothetical protein